MSLKLRSIILLFAISLMTWSTSHVAAAEYASGKRVIGLGVVLGEPTGLTGKWWVQENWAFDMGVSYSFFSYLHLMANSTWHFHDLLAEAHEDLRDFSTYLGVGSGVRISSKDKPKSGDARANWYLRVPMGVEWLPARPRIGPFIEFAPGAALAPKVFAVVQGGIGIRYYF